ncbi:MAG: tRNA (cytidine(34)-2'-O)-methyltransferase [Deltaproteobacteria bacterium]|nr:tRNA (cytidine(34)-2'-O)-methyltransferase [Deltaproteobacteria bacterium]
MPLRKSTRSHNLHVVLVFPEIPWNTGNAGRTCLAAGAQLHLVQPLGFSLEEKRLRRAGLDYWSEVNPQIWPSWASFEAELPNLGEPFLFTSEGKSSLWSTEFPPSSVLLFGRESGGLPTELRQAYGENTVSIPMEKGPVRSLNLSTSVALGVYEVKRQWACPPRS